MLSNPSCKQWLGGLVVIKSQVDVDGCVATCVGDCMGDGGLWGIQIPV